MRSIVHLLSTQSAVTIDHRSGYISRGEYTVHNTQYTLHTHTGGGWRVFFLLVFFYPVLRIRSDPDPESGPIRILNPVFDKDGYTDPGRGTGAGAT